MIDRPPHLRFEPGRNCWAVERATRYRVVQDGEEYYRRLRDALLSAERDVFILGWDINAATVLTPKEPRGDVPSRLDEFLRCAARRRPRTTFHILTWDYGMLFTLERDPLTRWRLGWRMPRNVRFAFDSHHPVGACHHQKVVVVDDSLAFSGSMDITGHRWDTTAHLVDDPARLDPTGKPYEPYHEVQAMVEGPAAARLGALARGRWSATGTRRLPPAGGFRSDLWPLDLPPDLTDTDVAIARTMAGPSGEISRECETLYYDAIMAAKHAVYIENQYLTHPGIAARLAARLSEENGPEVVLVLPRGGDGWLDRNTISVIRDELFRTLRASDRHSRLRMVHPMASRRRDVGTFVHSKVLIVDDQLLIVGSANTNRRSMGMDSECDIAVLGETTTSARAISEVRARLIGEHLGLSNEELNAAQKRAGSLRAVVDERQHNDRALVPFTLPSPPAAPLDGTTQYVVDPDGPIDVGRDLAALVPAADMPSGRVPLRVWIAPTVALVAAIIAVWGSVPSVAGGTLSSLQQLIATSRGASDPHLLMIVALFVVVGLTLIPLELALVATGALLGLERGVAIAVVGSLTHSLLGYGAGVAIGPRTVGRWMTRRSYKVIEQLGAEGVIGMAVVRMAGVASAGAVHLVAGAKRTPIAPFLAGTMLGLIPAVVALTALGALLGDTTLQPTITRALLTAAAALGLLASAIALRTFLSIRQFAPALARQRTRTETY